MRHILLACVVHCSVLCQGQTLAPSTMSKDSADAVLQVMRNSLGRDHQETINRTDALLRVYNGVHDQCTRSEVYGFRSASFTEIGLLDSAMSCAHRALTLFPSKCDSTVLIRGYVAMSRLYMALKEYPSLDSICDTGLGLWRPQYELTVLRNALLTNKAIGKARTNDLEGAKQIFRTILKYAIAENSPQQIDDAYGNLGIMMKLTGDLDSAAFCYRYALGNAQKAKNSLRVAIHYSNLANLASDQLQYGTSLPLWDSALVYAVRAKNLSHQVIIHEEKAQDLFAIGKPQEAYKHSLLRYELNDSLIGLEKVRSLTDMQEKYESEKKQREILALTAENLSSELETTKVTQARNALLVGSSAVVIFALGLWSRLRYVDRSRRIIRMEKEISESLLHNILPEEVAEEIKAKGYADVKEFETATILFTDFKGFTSISEKFSAAELVAEIDHCFKAFDGIVETYGIEKIKTIGDSYMAAGGLPDTRKGDPKKVVVAALEMQAFMLRYKKERTDAGKLFFEMRLGLHTGPVIAGIVGVKKYSYDIWGDTVNTASRMETSGEVGKVNISSCTYNFVKDDPEFRFIERGNIQAKGKGEMEMFFIERAS